MNFIPRIFRKKSDTSKVQIRDLGPIDGSALDASTNVPGRKRIEIVPINEHYSGYRTNEDYMGMFCDIAEVFWPINYIAKRISECHFDIKRIKDDSIVVCDRTGVARVINKPNPVTTWRELVYQHFVYMLATGNSYFRAAMSDFIGEDATIFRWCSNYWELPADKVEVVPANNGVNIPLFGVAELADLLKGYRLNIGTYSSKIIPPHQIWHDKDGITMARGARQYLESVSRLDAVRRNISNLIAVYEARNVIYYKRGAIGFIVSNKTDEAGSVALTPSEKKEIRDEMNKTYGVGEGQSPYGFSDQPLAFIRTNLSIAELQPFEETLEDAIKIAAIYGIPAVLVPRKDQSTFSNQGDAEKSVYTSTIIPMAKRFCDGLTKFLGLDEAGYYIDCDFSDVACLQVGLKDSVEVKKLTNEVCLVQFNCGIITINDWRTQMHEEPLVGDIYDKGKFDMTPEELALVDKIIKSQSSKGEIKDGNNNQMSENKDE